MLVLLLLLLLLLLVRLEFVTRYQCIGTDRVLLQCATSASISTASTAAVASSYKVVWQQICGEVAAFASASSAVYR